MSHFKNSLEEIELKTDLDYLNLEESVVRLKDSIDSLQHNGIIKICGLDMDEIARSLYFKFISIEDINRLMLDRKSFTTLEYRCNQLTSFGLNIDKKRINNHHYFIEARRP
jgi:hypothetical protein